MEASRTSRAPSTKASTVVESFGIISTPERRRATWTSARSWPHARCVVCDGERAARLEEATARRWLRCARLTAQACTPARSALDVAHAQPSHGEGYPTPSLRASEAELLAFALGRGCRPRRHRVHLRLQYAQSQSEFEMIDRLLTASGRPFSVSLPAPFQPTAGVACSAWSRLAAKDIRQSTVPRRSRAAGPAGKPHPILDVPLL